MDSFFDNYRVVGALLNPALKLFSVTCRSFYIIAPAPCNFLESFTESVRSLTELKGDSTTAIAP